MTKRPRRRACGDRTRGLRRSRAAQAAPPLRRPPPGRPWGKVGRPGPAGGPIRGMAARHAPAGIAHPSGNAYGDEAKTVTDILDELEWRDVIAQTTDVDALRKTLADGPD